MPGSLKRTLYALMLAKKENLPLIFSGGMRESDAAKETLMQLSDALDLNLTMPRTFHRAFGLYFEDKSLDTWENARFTRALLQRYGIKKPKIVLVTSAFHMPRAMMLFQKAGFQATPAPTDYKASSLRHFWYFPSITGLRLSYFALHEYAGYLRYWLKS